MEEGQCDWESLVAAAALVDLSHRIESANGSSPHLIQAASNLVSPDGDSSEWALALPANEEVLKPLTQIFLLNYLTRINREATTREAAISRASTLSPVLVVRKEE